MANDNTVAWGGKRLQIPPSGYVPTSSRPARVHQYPDATLSIFLGPHRLATYTAGGIAILAALASKV